MPTSFEMMSIERTREISSAFIAAQSAWRNIIHYLNHEHVDSTQSPITSEQFAHILDICFSKVEAKVVEVVQGLCTEREAFELFFHELEDNPSILLIIKTYEFFRLYVNYIFIGMIEVMNLRMAPSVVQGMLGVRDESLHE